MSRRAIIIWFTGMSGAGKSTIAQLTSDHLRSNRLKTLIIDGDYVRDNLHKHLSFSREDILENNHLVANLCLKNIFDFDVIFIPIISPYAIGRQNARQTIGETFYEVYIKASIDELVRRDTKGLYGKALEGKMDNLIGFSKSHPYEEPQNADLTIYTDLDNPANCVNLLINQIHHWLDKPIVNSADSELTTQ